MSCVESAKKLSVIMGVYNIAALPLFDSAVNSILTQTMGNFEFLICDDGSTDNTWEILTQLAQRDSRIGLIHNPKNEGLASALNLCLTEACGRYIARQDADDISAPERFAKQISFLEEHPQISFVGSNVTLWDERGNWGHRSFPPYPQPRDFLFTMPFVHGALMFQRESLEQIGGYRVSKETRRAEDYDLLMRMYAQGLAGANILEPLYYFREDAAAKKRRKYCYRVDEVKVRWCGFRELGLLPQGLPYVVKPLIAGILPTFLLREIKKYRRY